MISLDSERFAYDDGVPLLAGLTLTVRAGEYVVIAGASGSGKTTLARLLAGMTGGGAGSVFRGSIALDGETIRFTGTPTDPRIDPAAWSSRVAYVAQGAWGQLSMMSATVGEEIAFGPSNRGVPTERLRRLVAEVASSLKLTPLLDRDPRRLSGGQLQRTIIAAAVVQRPRILVLDEPFQGLDDDAVQDVAAALEALRRDGTAVVVCEPMLPRSAPSGARVVALADGHPVFDGALEEGLRAGLRRYGIGTAGERPRVDTAAAAAPVRPGPVPGSVPGPGPVPGSTPGPGPVSGLDCEPDREPDPPLVALRDVTFRYPAAGGPRPSTGLTDVNLSISAGEIVAVRGPNGSGKSTLLQHLDGLYRADSGSVTVGGILIRRQPTGTLATTVGYLFQDTDQQLFERTVLREVSYGPLATGSRRADSVRKASEALDRVGLGALKEAHPYELSFVQRRLVALASLMATGPLVWALDEPTAGLDEPTRSMLATLLTRHAEGGGAVLLATHDAAFADAVAHRSIWLEDGRIRGTGTGTGSAPGS
ncbi:ABC transporter ATP-binding protein [Arthrobacter burdickii]|uniref:ATP-binding cassette domain-containing protein n=1 Tax=Arthrobacter burdickii TaxID=3035920 RepID=A0ABT8K427_9MICC|nr:ABC transporter ATP-binding protein [Arthrobacter burdickii]MDN4612198.1 ATP-binding cassette domain-containing protein [Arthrobacter burdickii]